MKIAIATLGTILLILIAILWTIVLIFIGIVYIINHFDYDLLIPYITRRSKEEIINSRIRLFIIHCIVCDKNPLKHEEHISIDYEELLTVGNRYFDGIKIETDELVELIRACYKTNKEDKELEEKIEIQIARGLIGLVICKGFKKTRHILNVIDFEKFNQYLINYRY